MVFVVGVEERVRVRRMEVRGRSSEACDMSRDGDGDGGRSSQAGAPVLLVSWSNGAGHHYGLLLAGRRSPILVAHLWLHHLPPLIMHLF